MCSSDPSGWIVYSARPSGSFAALNAIIEPSGDHAGLCTSAGALVTCRSWVPSMSISHRDGGTSVPSLRTNATVVPSGLTAGSVSWVPGSDVSRSIESRPAVVIPSLGSRS